MTRAAALVLLVALVPTTALAGSEEPLIVDSDDCSPGSEQGTEENPFCSLQAAFDDPSLGPGAHIQLRDAADPYDGGTTAASPAGTAGAPIVIEPFPGHLPVVGGTLALSDVSYWQVRGLTFSGTAGLGINAFAPSSAGLVIADNTLVGLSIRVSGADDQLTDAPIVERNVVRSATGAGISVRRSTNAMIRHNVVREHGCIEPTKAEPDPTSIGIDVQDSVDGRVTRNQLLEFDLDGCARSSGILYQRGSDGRIDHNLLRGIQGAGNDLRMGITISNLASGVDIDHNIVQRVATCGICPGRGYSSGAVSPRITANTVIDIDGYAIDLINATDVVFSNNILAGAGDALVRADSSDTFVARNNLYWGGPEIGRCNNGSNDVTLEDWLSGCGSNDTGSISADPRIPAQLAATDDFTPAADSPAVDAGSPTEALATDFVGSAPDLGALEAPVPREAIIEEASPELIRLFIDTKDEALFSSGCEGLSVAVDDQPVSLTVCAEITAGLVEVELASPAGEGQDVLLSYSGDQITDATAVGGIIGARLLPFTLVVDNAAPPLSGTGTGEATGDTGDGTASTSEGSSGDEETAGAAPEDAGCSCRQARQPTALWMLVGLLLFMRRRRPLHPF